MQMSVELQAAQGATSSSLRKRSDAKTQHLTHVFIKREERDMMNISSSRRGRSSSRSSSRQGNDDRSKNRHKNRHRNSNVDVISNL